MCITWARLGPVLRGWIYHVANIVLYFLMCFDLVSLVGTVDLALPVV